jgi:hypothetical protein
MSFGQLSPRRIEYRLLTQFFRDRGVQAVSLQGR